MNISNSPAETEELGAAWARTARHGQVVALHGDLGAGKTHWVRGVARGLGSPARVHSPTFTLINEYPGGRLRLFHLDLYRLETPEQVWSAGIEDYLAPDGIAVIEWAERMSLALTPPPGLLHVRFEFLDGDRRSITHENPGP